MLSGFWEEAEEPIARADKETLLRFLTAGEPNTRSLDSKTNCNRVFEETQVVGNAILKPREAIATFDKIQYSQQSDSHALVSGERFSAPLEH